MTNQKCAVIISCFPGVGKTALPGLSHDGSFVNPEGKYAIYDVETMAQDPKSEEYWQTIETLAQEEDAVVLVAASGDAHRQLLSRGLRFVCVHPGVDIKDEYLRRYFDRAGIDRTWISLYRYWQEKIEELQVRSDGACMYLELTAGEDLEDMLPYIPAGVEEGAF
ncbi:hypothetical protein INS49_006171 [Diaporthe citri]|uniref:uncharacterized protein n=1 Tax=Diaporthe citri TaxID=83186 RepID=UPI001C7F7590|nr:uncharacterized protein INS49_006171 [Diaporthe citri]KAG6364569.1 hypothetical protein INS49_006171 [Diaporthe citri]